LGRKAVKIIAQLVSQKRESATRNPEVPQRKEVNAVTNQWTVNLLFIWMLYLRHRYDAGYLAFLPICWAYGTWFMDYKNPI